MRKIDVPPRLQLPAALAGLAQLAYNYWWCTDSAARSLWEELAARAGMRTAGTRPLNPVAVLEKLRPATLRALASDREFMASYRKVRGRFRAAMKAPRGKGPGTPTITASHPVAYFSMEFGIHGSLPIYAGGLGILAGDHVKTASDMGLPLVGIGLAYRQGYYRQEVDRRGRMNVVYPAVDYGKLALERVRDRHGKEVRIAVELPGSGSRPRTRKVQLRVWLVRVGRVTVYLLDTDFAANAPRDRKLTKRLYGGSREDRIAQEILLGIGGVRLIRALGLRPSVWHLNEGHVTFSALERIRELLLQGRGKQAGRLGFYDAVEAVAADTVFTTHTPVPEGNEAFDLNLARRYLAPLCPEPQIPVDDFLQLGLDWETHGHPVLSMTVLAIRLSRLRNGVSMLHGVVSREMWNHLWPDFNEDEVPITSVTNGIHVPTWMSSETEALFEKHVERSWRPRIGEDATWSGAKKIPDRELWKCRNTLRAKLVDFIRQRAKSNLVKNGRTPAAAQRAVDGLLDPAAFTIGFARRFALYKRAALLFSDLKKAAALFNSSKRPIQIIFSGKPHPEDPAGKRLFEKVVAISRRAEFRGKVVVLENYDMDIGAALVQGVDLWLNNPIRPQEASGTSGQKVPINGGLNASILDGWWFEGYEPEMGWAIGKAKDYDDPRQRDQEDAADLLQLLRRQVVPLFYKRGKDGIPHQWLRMVKSSMTQLIPRFSSHTMLGEYIHKLYQPAAENGALVQANGGALAADIATWRSHVECCWPMVHLRELNMIEEGRRQILQADYFLAGLSGEDVIVEVWAGDMRPGDEELWQPATMRALGDGMYRFRFTAPKRKVEHLGLRIWPYHPGLPHSMELGLCYEVEAEEG